MKRLHRARMFLGVESMNTTESLDGTGKSADLSSATGETAIPGDTSIAENKRRRLVRGAVAFAPLVLTLRSGALAAASCTGARLVQLPDNGKFSPGATSESCVREIDLDICPGYPTTAGNPTKLVNKQVPLVGVKETNTSSLYRCSGGIEGKLTNQTVAILSSQSATSMNVG